VITALVLGCGAGLGLLLVVRAVTGPRVRLADALAAMDRPRRSLLTAPVTFEDRLGRRAAHLPVVAAALAKERARADLRVTSKTAERHAFDKVAAAVAGLVVPLVLAVGMAANGVGVPGGVALVLAVALSAAGFLLPDLLLRDQAKSRRAAFTAALSSYLDLVNVVLAGGAGIETALEAAADAGDGWGFEELRAALARSRALRRSPWSCFDELGQELQITELRELAASVQLAGQQGARVRASLAAKAASLRGHQLAAVEAAAQSASERMALPTVLMFVGFLLFIGYPAVAEILGSSGW
jgi:Flp pilus assembly protein TadB